MHGLVPFDASRDQVGRLDLTAANHEITEAMIRDTMAFTLYIENKRRTTGCRYLTGGYNEHRNIYARSEHFNTDDEPRRLHLGVDIWGKAGTPVYAPLDGIIHSYQFNDHFGDYGATIILQHQIAEATFHTLYGHLDLASLHCLKEGDPVAAGQTIGRFGLPEENGQWPPHLHFQIIYDMEGRKGDYPGVCKFSERERYLHNCPDANIIVKL